MGTVLIMLFTLVLFLGGFVLLGFSYKSFKQKKFAMGIIFLIVGLFLIIPPTIMIVTTTVVTTAIMGR